MRWSISNFLSMAAEQSDRERECSTRSEARDSFQLNYAGSKRSRVWGTAKANTKAETAPTNRLRLRRQRKLNVLEKDVFERTLTVRWECEEMPRDPSGLRCLWSLCRTRKQAMGFQGESLALLCLDRAGLRELTGQAAGYDAVSRVTVVCPRKLPCLAAEIGSWAYKHQNETSPLKQFFSLQQKSAFVLTKPCTELQLRKLSPAFSREFS